VGHHGHDDERLRFEEWADDDAVLIAANVEDQILGASNAFLARSLRLQNSSIRSMPMIFMTLHML